MNQQKHITSQARIWTGFYRCHLIFWHSVLRRWAAWNIIHWMPIPSHCSCKNRDCELTKPLHSNFYPVELCDFACLGALNLDLQLFLVYIYIFIYKQLYYSNITARRCVLPGRFKWHLNMFKHYPSTCSNTWAGPVFWDFPDDEP